MGLAIRRAVSKWYDALGRVVVKFRWWVIAIWIVGTLLAMHVLPNLSNYINNNNSAFLPNGVPSAAANQLDSAFSDSSGPTVNVVVHVAHGTLTPLDQKAISREVTLLSRIKGVTQVPSPQVARDGTTANITVQTSLSGYGPSASNLIASVESTFREVGAPPGLAFYPAGALASQVANNATSAGTGGETQLLAIVFVLLLLLLVFRAVLAPLVTLLPAVLVVQLASAVVAELASHGVMQVSEITELLMIILIIGAGTDYGLFLVFRTREEMRAGRPPKEAVEVAMARVGESITFSAGTVIAASLCLLLATFGFYSGLALPLAIGIGVMLLAGLTLLPALLAVLGKAVFWPSVPKTGGVKLGVWGRVAIRVIRKPLITLLVGIVVFGSLAFVATGYRASGFGGGTNAPSGTMAARGDALLAAHYPRASANPQLLLFKFRQSLWTDPQKMAEVEHAVAADTNMFSSTLGPVDLNGTPIPLAQVVGAHAMVAKARSDGRLAQIPGAIMALNQAESSFVSANGKTLRLFASLTAGGSLSNGAMNAMPAVRAEISGIGRRFGAASDGVFSDAAVFYDINATSTHDLLTIIPVVIVVIAILLALVLRSLVAPFYLIVSVVISYLAALGMAVLIFMHIQHQYGLSFFLPFLMFLFLLALGEDYNILVMTRIREESHTLPLREAVTKAMGATGTTVTSAGLILAGTFATLALASIGSPSAGEVDAIGLGLAIGILMDTFLVRTLLIPSMVVILGRYNWWPSRVNPQGAAAD